MKYKYKTKSIEERIDIVNALISKYPPSDSTKSGLLYGIDTEKDWNDYSFVTFNTDKGYINLTGYTDYGDNYTIINTVEEFLDVCGINTTISYEGLTIPKHRFV
jgi:hypothetical protein